MDNLTLKRLPPPNASGEAPVVEFDRWQSLGRRLVLEPEQWSQLVLRSTSRFQVTSGAAQLPAPEPSPKSPPRLARGETETANKAYAGGPVSAIRCWVLDMQSSWSSGMLYVWAQFIVMVWFRGVELDDVLACGELGDSGGARDKLWNGPALALKPGEKISKSGPTPVLSIFCTAGSFKSQVISIPRPMTRMRPRSACPQPCVSTSLGIPGRFSAYVAARSPLCPLVHEWVPNDTLQANLRAVVV